MPSKITKELLYEEHIEFGKSAQQIANENNYSYFTIKKLISKHNIPYTKKQYKLRFKDRSGEKHGCYTVIEICDNKTRTWLCKCKCGNEKKIISSNLTKYDNAKKCNKCKNVEEISSTYLYRIKQEAKRRKIEYNLDDKYLWNLFIQQNRKCSLSGIELCFAQNYWKDINLQTASLDRIDSSKGYIEGNVQWVHKSINFMKHSLSEKRFVDLCFEVAKYKRGYNVLS